LPRPEYFTEQDVRDHLCSLIVDQGLSVRAVARALKIDHAYLHRMMNGSKPPRGKILKWAGFAKANVFVALPPKKEKSG
jgi:transcriptional regulator with XRE-family HTH domain